MESINDLSDLNNLLHNDDNDDGSESEGEEISAFQVLKHIENAWLNEKLSVEILPHKSIYVDCMYQQILQMEENISKSESEPRPEEERNRIDIRLDIYRLELERIRYIITSYLRIRLEKIERFTKQIIEQEAERSSDDQYLTFYELKYARSFLELNQAHLNLVLKKMPENMANLNQNQMLIRPNLSHFVFIRSNKNLDPFFVPELTGDEEKEIKLNEGTQFILPYKHVSDLVKNNSVQLI